MIIKFHTDFHGFSCLHPGAFSLRVRSTSSLADLFVPPSFRARLPFAKHNVPVLLLGDTRRVPLNLSVFLLLGRIWGRLACTTEGPAFSRVFSRWRGSQAIAGRVEPELNRISIMSTFSATDRQQPAGGVEPESNPARIPVKRVFVQ